MIRRTGAVLLCLILLPLLSPGISAAAKQEGPDGGANGLKGMELAAENRDLRLYYHKDQARIAVENRHTGKVWDSALTDAAMPEQATGIQIQEMKSLLSFSHTPVSSFSSRTSETCLESEEYQLEAEKRKDGFAYEVFIPTYDVSFCLVFSLDEYGLRAEIPTEGIKESITSKEKVRGFCEEMNQLLENQEKVFREEEEDAGIPGSFKKNLKEAQDCLSEMSELLKDITDPYGIGAKCELLSDQADRIDELMLGSAGKGGFYPSILKSEEITGDVKSRCRTQIKELKSEEVKWKVQIAQMKEIPAAAVVSVELLPYFGAAGDRDEGYVLYPDGCGAMTCFKETHGEFQSFYQSDTYSSLMPDIDWEASKDFLGVGSQPVPYFGIKKGEDAFIAYVCSGQAMSEITYRPSGYILPVHRTAAGFTYRQPVATSSTNGQWQSADDTMVFEEEALQYTAVVEYQFLYGEHADYSGMAAALRSYMEKEGVLCRSDLIQEGRIPLTLELLGGYHEKILAFDHYIAGTDVSEAKKMTEAFPDIPILCNYMGAFGEGYGAYPSEYQLEPALGNTEELKELSEELKRNGGQLFLGGSQLLADYEQRNYSEGELTIGNRYQILKSTDNPARFLLTPEAVKERLEEKLLPALGSYGNAGFHDSAMGSFVYGDFGGRHKVSRLETAELWKEIFARIKETSGAAGADGGGDYTFASVDWLRNVPDDVSGYYYTDKAVPFYSMLVHGYKICTSTADNQFYDEKAQTLRAIEFGFTPCFSLTEKDVESSRQGVYTSVFSAISNRIERTYKQYEKALGDVADARILRHESDGDIARVAYDNGVEIILNYSGQTVNLDGIQIGPESYVKIVDGEAAEDGGKKEEEQGKEAVEIKAQGEQGGIPVYSPLVTGLFVLLFVSVVLFGGISFFNRHRP